MTRSDLLRAVPGARSHHIAWLIDRGDLRPEPELVLGRRRYCPAHVEQLRAYVERLDRKRARLDARRQGALA